jgi:hypothetical protein
MQPWERQQRAMAMLERRQQLSANWQLALSDGATDMMTRLDYELRERMREVLEATEEEIDKYGPARSWKKFDSDLRTQLEREVRETFTEARRCARVLSEHVASALAGNRDGSTKGVSLAKLSVPDPEEALRLIKPMNPPKGGDGFARVINSLRGSYGGILMVGVLTSLAGLSLISAYSVAAGVALGLFTWWEDQKNGKQRAAADAKNAVAKLVDKTNFRVGEELRDQLRLVHRALRDHYTVINDRHLRAAAEAVNNAMAPS